MVRIVFTDEEDGSGSGDEVGSASNGRSNEAGPSKRGHNTKNGFLANDISAKSTEKSSTKGKSGAKVSKSLKSVVNEQYTINTEANVEYIIREEIDGRKNSEAKFLVELSVKPIILSRTEIAERFPLILERYIAKKEHEAQFGNREDLDRNSDGEAPQIVSSVKKEKIRSSSRKRTVVKKHETDRRNSGHIEGKPTKRNAAAEGKPKTVFKVRAEEPVESEYKVERILGARELDGKRQFRIRWAGFDSSYNTWEPEENLEHLEVFQKYVEKMEKEKAASEARKNGDAGKKKTRQEEAPETPRSTNRSEIETKGGNGRSAVKETKTKAARKEINDKTTQKEVGKNKDDEESGNEPEHVDELEHVEEAKNEDGDGEFNVERILDVREVDGNRQFRIKWAGFDSSYNTWEPEENLGHLEVLQMYVEKMDNEKAASESGKNGDEGKKAQTEEPPETPRSTRRSETKGGKALKGTNDKTPGKEVDVNDEEKDNESEHADAEEPKYEVERVMARRKVASKGEEVEWEYRIKWKGYKEITWEPGESIEQLDIIIAFNKRENAKISAADGGDGAGKDDPGPSSSNAEQQSKKRVSKRAVSATDEGDSTKSKRGRPLKKLIKAD